MLPSSHATRFSAVIAAIVLTCSLAPQTAQAAPPTDVAQRAALIGEPTALLVQPEALHLRGPRSRQQVIVTGRYGEGSVRDLTALAEFKCEGESASVGSDGFLVPVQNGETMLVVQVGSVLVKASVTVTDMDKPQPV